MVSIATISARHMIYLFLSKVYEWSLNLFRCVIYVSKLLKCILRSLNLFQNVTQITNPPKCIFIFINLSRGVMQVPKHSGCYFKLIKTSFATLNLIKLLFYFLLGMDTNYLNKFIQSGCNSQQEIFKINIDISMLNVKTIIFTVDFK